jgi:hypothetical protein
MGTPKRRLSLGAGGREGGREGGGDRRLSLTPSEVEAREEVEDWRIKHEELQQR